MLTAKHVCVQVDVGLKKKKGIAPIVTEVGSEHVGVELSEFSRRHSEHKN